MGEPRSRQMAPAAGGSARLQYRIARKARYRRQGIRWLLWASAVGLAAYALWSRAVGFGIAGVILIAIGAAIRPDRDPQRWLRGAAGEQQSALLLQQLRSSRWYVLHDRMVPGRTINLDHVVIGPSGVWLVDTKAFRAPLRRRWRRVEVGGRLLDTGPAAWEAELVAERLGVAVTPIVAVHGTGLSPRGARCGGVRVVPAASLVHRLRRGRRQLSRGEVRRLGDEADHLFPSRARPNARRPA